jgi:hypothetical protein
MATHDQIAAAVTRIYDFFVRIGYLKEEEVVRPSANASSLDVELCRANGFDDVAIDLMKLLPWTNITGIVAFAPGVRLPNWSEDWGIEASRFPTFPEQEKKDAGDEVIPSYCVPLAFSEGGAVPIIDAKHGKANS